MYIYLIKINILKCNKLHLKFTDIKIVKINK